MARYSKIREQDIAVFGESGSGKTVLASAFLGPAMEGSFSNDLWDLVAENTGQGNQLYQNYLGMKERATAPAPTRFAGTTYLFFCETQGEWHLQREEAAIRHPAPCMARLPG